MLHIKSIMKSIKKKLPKIQQPVLIATLIVAVIVTFWLLLLFLPKEQTAAPLVGNNDVRSGDQKISVSIVPPGTDTPANDISSIPSSPSGSQLITEAPAASTTAEVFKSAVAAGENVKFRIDRFQKLAVQPLKFELFDDSGRALTPDYLKAVRGNKVHFYLVHANLNEFHHMFPDFSNNVWNVSVNMPTPGTYFAYVAYTDLYGYQHVYRSDLVVRNESADDTAHPDPTANLEYFDGSRTAKLTMQRMDTGRLFALDLTKNGIALNPEPYLESTGYLTVLKHDEPDVFVSTAANVVKSVSPNPVFFNTPPLTPGRYTAFVEIKLEGKVYVFPLTFDVGTL